MIRDAAVTTMSRWSALTGRERGWLVNAMLALPLLRASLRLKGFQGTKARIEKRTPVARARPTTPAILADADRLARIAAIAGRRGPIAATCLPQALWVYERLRAQGLQPALIIGVRRQHEAFDAHAWVELDGVALGQAQLQHRPIMSTADPGSAPGRDRPDR